MSDTAASLLGEIREHLAAINRAKDELQKLGLTLQFTPIYGPGGTYLSVTLGVGAPMLPPAPPPGSPTV